MIEKFKYTDKELKELINSIVILIDKREKSNKHITDWFDKHSIPYIDYTMESGDYSFMLPQNEKYGILRDTYFDKSIAIERKNSLEELSGCFSQTRERFNDEWCRCKAESRYLLIENGSYERIVRGDYNTSYNSKSYLGTLHSFNHKYNLQIVFMPDPSYTPIFMYGTMQYYLRDILK